MALSRLLHEQVAFSHPALSTPDRWHSHTHHTHMHAHTMICWERLNRHNTQVTQILPHMSYSYFTVQLGLLGSVSSEKYHSVRVHVDWSDWSPPWDNPTGILQLSNSVHIWMLFWWDKSTGLICTVNPESLRWDKVWVNSLLGRLGISHQNNADDVERACLHFRRLSRWGAVSLPTSTPSPNTRIRPTHRPFRRVRCDAATHSTDWIKDGPYNDTRVCVCTCVMCVWVCECVRVSSIRYLQRWVWESYLLTEKSLKAIPQSAPALKSYS